MSLRWRIALGLAAIAALVCAFGAVGAYVTTANQLADSIDDSLLARSQIVEARGAPLPGGVTQFIPQQGCPPPGLVQPASAAQIVVPDGTIIKCI
jgi:hypothetical protein